MSERTVRANARTLPNATESRDEAIIERVNRRYNQPGLVEKGLELLAQLQSQNDLAKSLAAEFEVLWREEDAIARDVLKTDEELNAACDRTCKIADKILTLSGAHHLPTIRLKGLVYLWAESESLESLSERAKVTADRALVSLLRDLGADRPAAQRTEEASR
jgi:hypothetical protein